MKTFRSILWILCVCFAVSACGDSGGNHSDLDIGGDWHVWGIYDFDRAGDLSIAVLRVTDGEGQHIGYDVYADGESLGSLLCEIRCSDGGYLPADMDADAFLVYEDYNGDGRTDIGAPLVNGDILWYLRGEGSNFSYFETQKGNEA